MSIQLWEGYFLRWVQTKTVNIYIAERRRMLEIVTRNKEAQVTTMFLLPGPLGCICKS